MSYNTLNWSKYIYPDGDPGNTFGYLSIPHTI